MCGIVGYTGSRRVVPVLLEGLRRLEYRGYDSAGLVYCLAGRLVKSRCRGKLANLAQAVDDQIGVASCTGLGHTRWATHGAPTEDNAHPHSDCSGRLVVVHNGIIENYGPLKSELQLRGHRFSSQTDTEVLAHLIEEQLPQEVPVEIGLARQALVQAVRRALTRVEGSYALGVLWTGAPDTLVAARSHSPLVLGVLPDASLMASDVPALLPYTRDVIFLDDGEMALLTPTACQVLRLADGAALDKPVTVISWNAAMAEKAGFKHFMLKEIYEQPQAILNTISGRIGGEEGQVVLPELGLDDEALRRVQRIALVACGTSWHAALVAKYWLERFARLPVEVDIASEFRYRDLLVDDTVLTVSISQSGETADTLAGIRRAASMGSKVLTICNVVGSTMTREADGTIYTHAGPEIGVASTKAFTSQLTALMLLTMHLGRARGTLPPDTSRELARGLLHLAEVIEAELPRIHQEIGMLAERFHQCRDFLFVGRGLTFPIALEGALKLKEISYIHAEGYAAGELKHGPIALIDPEMPVLALVPDDAIRQKTISNIEEIRARQARLLLIGSVGDSHLASLSDEVLYLPRVMEELNPILYAIPAQLLAYAIADRRGCDVDQPRNLAKSVTVE